MERSLERLLVLERIKEYEKKGYFDKDVENDPPTVPLKPGQVDYTLKKLSSKISSEIANFVAKRHFDKLIEQGQLVIKEVRGIENYLSVADRGAMITCNHFNPFDNYAVFKAIEKSLGRKRLFKVIREGNYTSFGGLYGYFFRHCNTLPLGSDIAVMRELMVAVNTLLKRGEKILIYPEQGMWWNYRKPRPLKEGAFRFAARANAPVVPVFITMEDTETLGGDGFPIQAYTVHFLPPIYPQEGLNAKQNAAVMMRKNFSAWKQVYEEFYGIPLEYTTERIEKCSIQQLS
jgi:1-acyl-sn-glycerol-3-phosphate acyltransferase